MNSISFARHQFPPDVIRHAVWLYLRFTLSLRDVEEMLAERGLDLTYETVRRCVTKFGPLFARELRKRPTGRWHLDEMVVKIAGKRHWLWRAVDDEGEVLDILVQSRRDTRAAVRLMRNLIKKQGGAGQGPRQAKLGGVDSVGLRPRSWSPTGWAHTEPPSGSSVFWLATSRVCARTTGPRTRISRHAGASARCNASSRPDRPSALCPPMLRSTTPSTPNATSFPAAPSASSEPRPPLRGRRLRPRELRA